MNPQMLLQVITNALAREQQARDQLEAALAESRAEVTQLQAQLNELKPPRRRRSRAKATP